ncbi:MAG: hypothetical protein UT55_C0047G0003 [Candidatus Peregrinibacteria bacterium GW2011_GWE2_39_6]|nr:MAG: hypothetical protein UT36_C0001G0088 [Candidatus Peregrinibacteria bacterium GW2011_GWF2_39_17]KKR25261.1 MAG: hypothetical protein UT55_C0047G0003 [Candidatus Peregrinibacteria bacterium GW2011_GWE2_39_6]HCW32430.1 hypothetical protein [Candidatus Peregrinibacteria bacterium]
MKKIKLIFLGALVLMIALLSFGCGSTTTVTQDDLSQLSNDLNSLVDDVNSGEDGMAVLDGVESDTSEL